MVTPGMIVAAAAIPALSFSAWIPELVGPTLTSRCPKSYGGIAPRSRVTGLGARLEGGCLTASASRPLAATSPSFSPSRLSCSASLSRSRLAPWQPAGWSPRWSGTGLNGVAFVNASDGWAVGFGGTILHTTNGGATWTVQNSGTTSDLYGVAFVNASDGWAVGGYPVYGDGEGDNILATTNGGATWTAQSSGAYLFKAVAFANASDGWAVSGAVTFATTNGGATWTAESPGPNGRIVTGCSVACANASDAWVAGEAGIFATTDGGATWSLLPNTGQGVACANASDVWVVGNSLWDYAAVLHSTNGGATWTTQWTNPGDALYVNPYLNGVAFANASDGWAVGFANSGGFILHTTNGGATWSLQCSGRMSVLNAVACPNANDAWVVGGSAPGVDYGRATGTILATTNGGLAEPKLTLKLRAVSWRLAVCVTVKGTVKPASLAGDNVTLIVQRKQGSTWRKVTSLTRKVSTKGTYSASCKPSKAGSYRLRITIAKSAASTAAATAWRTFKVM